MKIMLVDSPEDPVRLAFVHVFQRRAGMTNADGSKSPDKFEINPIFRPDGENARKVREAIAAVAKEKYGIKPAKISDKDGNTIGEKPAWEVIYGEFAEDQRGLRIGNFKKTKSGDIYGGFADMLYVAARNADRPTVVGAGADGRGPFVEGDGKPYGGCYGSVSIDVWALNKPGVKKRIVTDLLGVQFTRDGDAFSASAGPEAPDNFPNLSAEPDSVEALMNG